MTHAAELPTSDVTPGWRGGLDALGATTSILCAAHCALTPLVVSLLPLAGLGFIAGEVPEWILMGLSATLGVAGLGRGYRRHRTGGALVVLGAGLALLAAGRVAEGYEADAAGTAAGVLGGLIVAAAHMFNRHLCRACIACRGDESPGVPAGHCDLRGDASTMTGSRRANARRPT